MSDKTTNWFVRIVGGFFILLGLSTAMWARGEDDLSLPPQEPFGQWVGHYFCSQGLTGLTLTVQEDRLSETDMGLKALFDFYPLDDEMTKSGQFTMQGRWDQQADKVILSPDQWVIRPDGWQMVGLSLSPATDFSRLTGLVTESSCGPVYLSRK